MHLLTKENTISACPNCLARISERALTSHTVWTADIPLGWVVAVKLESRAWVVARVACLIASTTRFGTRVAGISARGLIWLIALAL
jgi:hypothetical protein